MREICKAAKVSLQHQGTRDMYRKGETSTFSRMLQALDQRLKNLERSVVKDETKAQGRRPVPADIHQDLLAIKRKERRSAKQRGRSDRKTARGEDKNLGNSRSFAIIIED